MTWLAAIGFASTNIGDAVAGRARIASESALLTERLDRLRHERAGITEMRPVAAIDIELQKAQPEAQAVWRITDGCRDVTRPASARACATVLELRQAHAAAARRDAIDVELREIQSRLAALPAVGNADPQATSAAEIVRLAQRRHVQPGAGRRGAAARARPRARAVARRPDRDDGAGAGAAGVNLTAPSARGRNTRDRDTCPAPAACRPRCRACRRAAAAHCGSLPMSKRASVAKPFCASAIFSDSATISGGSFSRAATTVDQCGAVLRDRAPSGCLRHWPGCSA